MALIQILLKICGCHFFGSWLDTVLSLLAIVKNPEIAKLKPPNQYIILNKSILCIQEQFTKPELSKPKTDMKLRGMNLQDSLQSENEEVVKLYNWLVQWGFPDGEEAG